MGLFEGHHHKEQDTVLNEVQGPVTSDPVEVQHHIRGCFAACCVHAPLCPQQFRDGAFVLIDEQDQGQVSLCGHKQLI